MDIFFTKYAKKVVKIGALILIGTLFSLSYSSVGAQEKSISSLAHRAGISIAGTLHECYNNRIPQTNELCKQVLRRDFSGMKIGVQELWKNYEPVQGQRNYTHIDRYVNFAKENFISLHFAHVLWARNSEDIDEVNSYPSWVFPDSELESCSGRTDEELKEILDEHITSLMSRYASDNVITAWNVENELFNEKGEVRSTCFTKILGNEYVDFIFKKARLADPDGVLVLNESFYSDDLGGINIKKANAVLDYIQAARLRGVPIDALGIQNHLRSVEGNHFHSQYITHLRTIFDRAQEIGIPVIITEMDVYQADKTQLDVASTYKKTVALCLEHSGCDTVITWGVSDVHTWLRRRLDLLDAQPLLFDEEYKPKLAYFAVIEALEEYLAANPDCPADLTNNGTIDLLDYGVFLQALRGLISSSIADFNGDSSIDLFDYAMFIRGLKEGCEG